MLLREMPYYLYISTCQIITAYLVSGLEISYNSLSNYIGTMAIAPQSRSISKSLIVCISSVINLSEAGVA